MSVSDVSSDINYICHLAEINWKNESPFQNDEEYCTLLERIENAVERDRAIANMPEFSTILKKCWTHINHISSDPLKDLAIKIYSHLSSHGIIVCYDDNRSKFVLPVPSSLIAQSHTIQNFFLDNLQNPLIEFTDISPTLMRKILLLCNNPEELKSCTQDEALELYRATVFLDMAELNKSCSEYLSNTLKNSSEVINKDFLKTQTLKKLFINKDNLDEQIIAFLNDMVKSLILAKQYQNHQLAETCSLHFSEIVQHNMKFLQAIVNRINALCKLPDSEYLLIDQLPLTLLLKDVLSSDQVEVLSQLKCLQTITLNLYDRNVTNDHLKALKDLPKLTVLDFGKHRYDISIFFTDFNDEGLSTLTNLSQ